MALQQAAKTVRAHSRVQTEHIRNKLCASKGIIALMKLCFLFAGIWLWWINLFMFSFSFMKGLFTKGNTRQLTMSLLFLFVCVLCEYTHTYEMADMVTKMVTWCCKNDVLFPSTQYSIQACEKESFGSVGKKSKNNSFFLASLQKLD